MVTQTKEQAERRQGVYIVVMSWISDFLGKQEVFKNKKQKESVRSYDLLAKYNKKAQDLEDRRRKENEERKRES